jgi:uncharacterized membrane protein
MKLTKKLPAAELLVVCSVILATMGQLVIKLGLGHTLAFWSRTPFSLPSPFTMGVLGGLAIYGLGTVLWVVAVSQREISYLYPLASINYILVALSGHVVLKERLMMGRWIGIGVMIAGIVLLTYAAPKEITEPCS